MISQLGFFSPVRSRASFVRRRLFDPLHLFRRAKLQRPKFVIDLRPLFIDATHGLFNGLNAFT